MELAKRMSRLGTETAFDVLVKAKALEAQGRDVVHLEIGKPNFDTPKNICDAAVKAIRDGYTHYGPAAGLPELREAIAKYISESRGIEVSIDEVVVTPGAKPIMFFGILSCVDEGDEVIYPNPGFPIYESVIDFLGARPVPIPLREERDFRLDVNELGDLITDRTRMVIINSPQNPTGSVLTPDDLTAIAELCAPRGIPVLADEIYNRVLSVYLVQLACSSKWMAAGIARRAVGLSGPREETREETLATRLLAVWRSPDGCEAVKTLPQEVIAQLQELVPQEDSAASQAASPGRTSARRPAAAQGRRP